MRPSVSVWTYIHIYKLTTVHLKIYIRVIKKITDKLSALKINAAQIK